MTNLLSEMAGMASVKKQAFVRKLCALLLLVPAAIFLFSAYILGTIALLQWLEFHHGEMLSFLILGGGYAVLGCIIIVIAKWQSKPDPVVQPTHSDTNNLAETAAGVVQDMAKKNLPTSLILTLVAGFAYGVSQQRKRD